MMPTRRFSSAVLATATFALGLPLLAQSFPPLPPPPPPSVATARDATLVVPVPVGTARISGVVVTTDASPKPVRRATVNLRDTDRNSTRMALTDADGRFAFDRLAAGRYTINVNKPAFVPATYGARTRGGQGLTIALTDGQVIGNLQIPLTRGAVISGRVVDNLGRPVPSLRLTMSERVVVGGDASYRPSGFASTDDRGEYRAFGLPAGTYVVAAQTGGLFGAGGARVTTDDEVRWAQAPTTGTPGTVQAVAPGPRRGQPQRYAPVYYPSATDPTLATPVTVAAGEERTGVNVTVSLVPVAVVTGSISRSDGEPLPRGALVTAFRDVAPQGLLGLEVIAPAQVNARGEFTIQGLLPGRYTLTARAGATPQSPAGAGALPSMPNTGANVVTVSGAGNLWAMTEIDVAGEDLAGVRLTLAPGMTVGGRIEFEATKSSPPTNVSQVATVGLSSPPGAGLSIGSGPPQIDADGAFRFTGVAPGSFYLTANLRAGSPATGPTPPWMVKSATIAGRDVLDTPFDLRPGLDVSDAVVTLTDRVTQISGLVTDQVGRPAPTYSVIVFSVDPKFWRQGSRWVRSPTRPASDGRYSMTGLPPGDYYLALITEFQPNEWFTPGFLQQVVPGAIRLTLAIGETKTQDLKLAGGGGD